MRKETGRNPALFILCAASFPAPFMGSAINLPLPQISKTFSMKAVSLSWIATACPIAAAVFLVAGRI
jgi:hypothetical protein